MKDTEIEIQVKVSRTSQLIQFLKKNAELVGEFRQIDEYYTPKHKNFSKRRPIKEWLRLRKSSNGNFITYKNWIFDVSGRSWHCDEYETKIDNLELIKKIFSAIDFIFLCKVDKTRTIYRVKKYEVSLDKIKGLGSFIEMEYKGAKKIQVKKAVEKMKNFLKQHGCGTLKRNNGGYPFMLMFPKEVRFEVI